MREARFVRALLLLAAGCLSGCVTSGSPTPERRATAPGDGCRVTYVVDGDTVHLACPETGEVKARLLGFDTPEVYSPGCGQELAAGRQATEILRQMLRSGPVTGARFDGHDRYGRDLVRLEVAGQDVARAMISTGYAVPYDGGRSPDWCAML